MAALIEVIIVMNHKFRIKMTKDNLRTLKFTQKIHVKNYERPQKDDEGNESSSSICEQVQSHFNNPKKCLKYKFAHSIENLLVDINTGVRT